MNQPQYLDGSHAPAPASAYSSYGQPQALQPATHSYAPAPYPQYPYPNTMPPMSAGHPVTSSMPGQMVPQSLPLPTMASNAPPPPGSNQQFPQSFDTTGQIAPPGMKPRVTATLWEDEGSLCFQVEANGVCVARREDNHMINGTKLLNVAGMTRGRRDGILKSEKTRHVVKIGPMHLKGVWIPFDRALDFANKEKITEMLYPLFVHNIGALLYHPTNQARQSIGNAAMAARRPDSQPEYMRTPQGTQAAGLTHHHSMANPVNAGMPQAPHSIAPHPSSGRPVLDRAHTFPTPPASASSLIGIGSAGSSYEYGGPTSGMQTGQPLSIDTSMNTRNVPTSPAPTPPGSSQAVQYQNNTQPSYQNQAYSTPSAYPSYGQPPTVQRYGPMQTSPGGVKTEMGPPARNGTENDHDAKTQDGYGSQQDADGEHEGEYTHNRPVQDSSQIAQEMTHSPHQNGSGRATPRTTNTYTGYNSTQQRGGALPSSNLNYVVSNDTRSSAPNGTDQAYQTGYQPPTQFPSMNGNVSGTKRSRDDDEQVDSYGRPMSASGDAGLKRQRTDLSAMSSRPISQPQSVKAGGVARR